MGPIYKMNWEHQFPQSKGNYSNTETFCMFCNKSPFRQSIKEVLKLQKRCQGLVPAALPQKESEIQIVERGG